MALATPKCNGCGERLIIHGHNGSRTVSPQHFYYNGEWYCDERCYELWVHRVGTMECYDPEGDHNE